MKILYVAKLSDSKLKEKLIPLLRLPIVEKVVVLRDYVGETFDDKINYLVPKNNGKGIRRHIDKISIGVSFCRRNDIDVIVGVLNTPHGYIGMIISYLTKIPYVHVTIAGQREYWRKGKLFEIINCWLFKRANFVTVTGNQTKRYLLDKGFDNNKVIVLPNIPDEAFIKITSVPQLSEREYDVVIMSRVDRNKNIGLLLKVVLMLRNIYPLRTLIVGDGESLSELKQFVIDNGLQDIVEFKSPVYDVSEKIIIYKNSRMFVSTSRGEGFAVSLLEAMCCGCVPIISNVGDMIDVIRYGINGYYFNNVDDTSELIQCFNDYITNNDKENLRKEAMKIQSFYTVDNVSSVWSSILSGINNK